MPPFHSAGAKLTVRQACYLLLQQKRDHKQRGLAYDMQMRTLKDVLLPSDNLLPPSLHLMEKVAGSMSVTDVSYHVCINDCFYWEFLPKTHWQEHAQDACPVCQQPRFKQSRELQTSLQPQKVFPYLPVSV